MLLTFEYQPAAKGLQDVEAKALANHIMAASARLDDLRPFIKDLLERIGSVRA